MLWAFLDFEKKRSAPEQIQSLRYIQQVLHFNSQHLQPKHTLNSKQNKKKSESQMHFFTSSETTIGAMSKNRKRVSQGFWPFKHEKSTRVFFTTQNPPSGEWVACSSECDNFGPALDLLETKKPGFFSQGATRNGMVMDGYGMWITAGGGILKIINIAI